MFTWETGALHGGSSVQSPGFPCRVCGQSYGSVGLRSGGEPGWMILPDEPYERRRRRGT
jgi:hypothetical protein